MRHFFNVAAHRGGVGPFNNLIQLGEADTAHNLFLVLRETNRTPIVLNFNRAASIFFIFRHFETSCGFEIYISNLNLQEFPYLFATQAGDFQRIFHPQQPIKSGSHNIMRIV